MEIATTTSDGNTGSTLEFADSAFGVDFNEPLIHQVVTAYFAGARSGTKAQKTRSEVRGGGRKPWRQKGTGNARAGTIRSPIWRGGGRALAARPRSYAQKVNRKMYRGALRSVVSELIRRERLTVIDDFNVESHKTKEFKQKLDALTTDNVLLVIDEPSDALLLASRNLHWVGIVESEDVNPALLIAFERVIFTVAALRKLEERLK